MRRFAFLAALLLCAACVSAMGEETAPAEIYRAPRQIVISFTGDCTLGCTPIERGLPTGFESCIETNGYEYPFANVRDIFLQDDLTVINLEGVFYDSDQNLVKKAYNFRAPTSYARILPLSGIEAASFANNHVLDYSAQGQFSTMEALEAQGTAWFGTNEYADKTFIFEKDGVKIGFVAAYISDWMNAETGVRDKLAADCQALRDAGCAVIIGCMHGGVEYSCFHEKDSISAYQEKFANALIRYGADIVVGHHPHTIQGITVDGGRTILWSLGNFCFGGNSQIRQNGLGESVISTLIAQFTLSFDDRGTYLGHQLNIIPCHTSGSKDRNDYQPCPVTGKDAEAVLRAIQRDTTPRSLKLKPYVEGVGAIQEFVPAPAVP